MSVSTALLEDGGRHSTAFPFYVYDVRCSAGVVSTPPHWHEELEIIRFDCGGTAEINRQPIPFRAGDILFVNPEDLHTATPDADGRLRTVVFDYAALGFGREDLCQTRLLDPLRDRLLLFPPILRTGEPFHGEVFRLFQAVVDLYRYPDTLTDYQAALTGLRIKCALYELLAFCHENGLFTESGSLPGSPLPQYVKAAVAYMERHLTVPVTAGELAAHVGLSKNYFIHIFKKVTGQTPAVYLRNLRVAAAVRLLREGHIITAAALASGFSSASYFNRVFREVYGCTPREFLKS